MKPEANIQRKDSKIGAAILGFYAAIKICEREGYDWRKVAELVRPVATEHAKEQSNG